MSKFREKIKNEHIKHNGNIDRDNELNTTMDEISSFISKIQNKYSGNAEQKHLNQLYDVGILLVNREFNHDKIVKKIAKIIDERSYDNLKSVRESKRKSLLDALKQGINDAMSDEYRLAYDNTNKYQYDNNKIIKRAHIDRVLHNF